MDSRSDGSWLVGAFSAPCSLSCCSLSLAEAKPCTALPQSTTEKVPTAINPPHTSRQTKPRQVGTLLSLSLPTQFSLCFPYTSFQVAEKAFSSPLLALLYFFPFSLHYNHFLSCCFCSPFPILRNMAPNQSPGYRIS